MHLCFRFTLRTCNFVVGKNSVSDCLFSVFNILSRFVIVHAISWELYLCHLPLIFTVFLNSSLYFLSFLVSLYSRLVLSSMFILFIVCITLSLLSQSCQQNNLAELPSLACLKNFPAKLSLRSDSDSRYPSQCNNMFIFPGIGLAASVRLVGCDETT